MVGTDEPREVFNFELSRKKNLEAINKKQKPVSSNLIWYTIIFSKCLSFRLYLSAKEYSFLFTTVSRILVRFKPI